MSETTDKIAKGAGAVFGCVLYAGYLGMGLVQLFAIFSGVSAALDLHWIIQGPLCLIIAYLPLVGSCFGVWGAMTAWDWSFWPAFFLFFWHLGFFALALLFSGGEAIWSKIRK